MKNLMCAGHSLYAKSLVVKKKKKGRNALFNKASLQWLERKLIHKEMTKIYTETYVHKRYGCGRLGMHPPEVAIFEI